MKVHHLNCATMEPRGGRLVNGEASICARARMVCHCLLVETEAGLVLIDTGFGLKDMGPRGWLYEQRLRWLGARLDPGETAIRQISALGYDPEDVRHIVLTHLDLDHAGGLADFPRAQIHVLAAELEAAEARRTWRERQRYEPATWSHQPRWVRHAVEGERWHGFEAVRRVQGLPPELLLIPLAGHTRGHCGVAVETGDRWLLHAGDSYFHAGEVNPYSPWCPKGLAAFQRIVAMDDALRLQNQARLQALVREHGEQVSVFSAHDPDEFERLAKG